MFKLHFIRRKCKNDRATASTWIVATTMSNRRNIRLLSLFSIEMKLKIRYIIIFLHNDVLCYGTMAIDNVRIVQSDLFEFEFTESWLKTTPKSGKYSFCFIIEFSVFFISPCPIFKMNWSMLYNIYNEFTAVNIRIRDTWYYTLAGPFPT